MIMRAQSFLIQETVNNILSSLPNSLDAAPIVLKDSTLAKQFKVSRTSIKKSLIDLESKGIVSIVGSDKTVVKLPSKEDYFEIKGKVSCKEKMVEKYFFEQINQGKMKPGHYFSESELAKNSGCNTISVREFLIRFSRLGIIEKKPRTKWKMVEFDTKFVNELVEFRRILEMNSITKLMSKSSDKQSWQQLSDLLDEHKAILADFDNRYLEFSQLDSKFHYTIQQASDNRFFTQFFDVISLIYYYQYQSDEHDKYQKNLIAITEHIDILTHLLANNTSGVFNAMEKHLDTSKNTLLAVVK